MSLRLALSRRLTLTLSRSLALSLSVNCATGRWLAVRSTPISCNCPPCRLGCCWLLVLRWKGFIPHGKIPAHTRYPRQRCLSRIPRWCQLTTLSLVNCWRDQYESDMRRTGAVEAGVRGPPALSARRSSRGSPDWACGVGSFLWILCSPGINPPGCDSIARCDRISIAVAPVHTQPGVKPVFSCRSEKGWAWPD
jgi:hypothetical protein